MASYASPKLASRSTFAGHGMFTTLPINKGEVLAVFGGVVCDLSTLQAKHAKLMHLSIQVEDNLYLVPEADGRAEHFNHSCEPNAGIRGQITLVALRDIPAGEEVTYDYAMSDGSNYDEFDCRCGRTLCRGRITGSDWQRPELRARYGDFFSTYLRARF